MRKILATSALIAAAFAASPSFAEIKIGDAYARTSGMMARSGAAFMHIMNTGPEDDRMIAASSDVAKRVELHTHILDDGVMKMREVTGGFPVAADSFRALKRGGDHVMFLGLTKPLKDGDDITVTLTFEKAGDITVTIPVDLNRDANAPMQHDGGHDPAMMQHGKMGH